MARMIKFATAESGTLVYRTTGRAYQGAYTVRENRVYGKTGRLIGYIGKPTAAQSKEITRLDRRRQTERRRRTLDATLASLDVRYQTMGESTFGLYSRRQLTEINFGHFLTEAVNAGKMTRKEARDRLERYLNTESSSGRTAQWDELKNRFKEMGFPYP